MACYNHQLVYKMREIVATFKEKYTQLHNVISIECEVFVRCYGAKCMIALRDEKRQRNVLENIVRVTCQKEIEILTAFLDTVERTISLLQDGFENDLPSSETPIVID